MEFSCSVCQYTSTKKSSVTRHINKKLSCGSGQKEIIEIPIEIKCEYCNKKFSTIHNLTRHKKEFCKQKDKAKDEEIAKLKEELRKSRTSFSDEKEDKEYIYLIKIYPYVDNIYKVGRTEDIQKRLADYKRYKIVFITSCENASVCEKDLIRLYKSQTIHCEEMGNEYFSGEYQIMKRVVQEYFGT